MTKLNNFVKLMRNKKALLNCIFFTLLTQIAITMGFIKLFNATKITEQILNLYKSSFSFGVLIFLLFIISMFLIYVMIASSLSYSQKYIVFILFSLIEAFFLHIILSNYSDETIQFAFYSTIAIFVSLFIFGLFVVYLGYDLGWLGLVLFMALFVLIITQLVFMFIGNYDTYKKVFSVISLSIFVLYIIYDTNKILLKYDNTTQFCITGALDYYLDIINIFIDMLRLSSNN
jgi:uncharacterized protein